MTILYVDDDEPRSFVRDVWLREQGYRVLHAANGADAMKLFDRHHPGAVLVDVRLPDADGLELCRSFKKISPQTAVILFSAFFRTPHDQAEGLREGADRYIVEPADRASFLEAVRQTAARLD